MIIIEYRIPLPLTVEDYRRAQLYMVAKSSMKETQNGEGVEILENRPYEDAEKGKGQYTHKIIHIGSKLPSWLNFLLPSSALQVHEKAWNDYPRRCETVYSCPFLGDRFSISLISTYIQDRGDTTNALAIPPDELKQRTVDLIDICTPVPPEKYDPTEDPCVFKATKTQLGPFQLGWSKTHNPTMTCYKLAKVNFSYWGLQTRIETFIQTTALRATMVQGHRQAVCWADEWVDKTMDDIRAMEEELANTLKNKIHGTETVAASEKPAAAAAAATEKPPAAEKASVAIAAASVNENDQSNNNNTNNINDKNDDDDNNNNNSADSNNNTSNNNSHDKQEAVKEKEAEKQEEKEKDSATNDNNNNNNSSSSSTDNTANNDMPALD